MHKTAKEELAVHVALVGMTCSLANKRDGGDRKGRRHRMTSLPCVWRRNAKDSRRGNGIAVLIVGFLDTSWSRPELVLVLL